MKYLFGPVKSRRLGISLGIDLVPFKTCTLNCVYCECGETTSLTTAIDEYAPFGEVIKELDEYLSKKPVLDNITFAGSGEPLLYSRTGEIIDHLKFNYPDYNVCILTNGTLLYLPGVRKAALKADTIIPSLDAVSEDIFKKINRPAPGITVKEIIDGLKKLRMEFKGDIFLEIFIVPGLNDTEKEINKLKEVCGKIKPDAIQLNSLDRPGTEGWVKKASLESLKSIRDRLSPFQVTIAGESEYGRKDINRISEDISGTIIATISRRPSTYEDLSAVLGVKRTDLNRILKELLDNGKIEEAGGPQGPFYKLRRA